MEGPGDGTDKGAAFQLGRNIFSDDVLEIEGFFNLLTAHLFSLYTTDSEELSSLVASLQNAATSASSEQRPITYRM